MKVITIGRGSENDVVIDDPYVSIHHLQIKQQENGNYLLMDCSSTNGTFVNGQRVYGETKLNRNDHVRIGHTNLTWMNYFENSNSTVIIGRNLFAGTFSKFEGFIKKCDFKSFDNLMFILPQLPLLQIRKGYVLDAFKEGVYDFGWGYHLFCHKKTYPIFRNLEDREMKKFVKQIHDNDEKKSVIRATEVDTSILPYFTIPFTEEGVVQAWLLNNCSEFMPKFWHANYCCKTFVFNIENVLLKVRRLSRHGEHVFSKIKALDSNSLLPYISIVGKEAFWEYAYWNDWSGLVKVKNKVVKDGATVRFHEPERKNLVEYHCNTIF